MIATLLFLIRREIRDRYPTPFAIAGEAIGLLGSLAIYWYTARAFAPGFSEKGGSYFHYLVIGETTLFAPLALFQALPRAVRSMTVNGTLEAVLAQPVSATWLLSVLGGSLLPLEALRALLTLALATVFFGLTFSWGSIWAALLLQLAALPVFLAFGWIAVATLIRFGRGDSLLGYLAAAGAILGGAYFPVTVLPQTLQSSGWLSPFSILLESTRSAIAGSRDWLEGLWGLLVWAALALPFAAICVKLSFKRALQAGKPELLY